MKNLLFACLAVVVLFVSGNSAAAQSEVKNKGFEYADANVKQAVGSDFLLNYADTLDSIGDFQASTSASYHSAILGEGIAFYHILTEDSNNMQFAGYKFPLYLNKQQIGVIDAVNDAGTWKVQNISNYNQFDQDLEAIKAKISGTAKLRIIEDKRYHLKSVYVSDSLGERFVDLKSGKVITKKEFDQSIDRVIASQANITLSHNEAIPLGYGENLTSEVESNVILSLVFLVIAIGFAISFVILMYKHKKETVQI